MAQGAQIRAAESALLVGAAVANYGNISVGDGMIALVAGGEVRLARADGRVVVTADRPVAPDPDRWAVVQAGTLDAGRGSVSLTAGDAYSLAINHSGITRAREIHAEGGDGGLVEVAGQLDASSRAAGETGGRIEVLGEQVLVGDAALDASGVGRRRRDPRRRRPARRRRAPHRTTHVRVGWRDSCAPTRSRRATAAASSCGPTRRRASTAISPRAARARAATAASRRSRASRASSRAARSTSGAQSGDVGTLLYDPLRIVIRGGSNDGTDTDDANDPAQFLRGDAGGAGSRRDRRRGHRGRAVRDLRERAREHRREHLALGGPEHPDAGHVRGQRRRDPARTRRGDGSGRRGRRDPARRDPRHRPHQHGGGGELAWELSNGGSFALSTESSSGRAVDIAVGAVDVSGDGRRAADAGSVTLLSRTGSIEVGVDPRGAAPTAAAGDGGDGGQLVASALEGSITVGDVDVSGGEAVS